ncbi:MAG: hypothetical protein JNL12_22765 [Planctomycetes bacterium]|nr:hypothetical protein [Planctomycetota bacterium]
MAHTFLDLSHSFDSNAVRDLGELPEPDWQQFLTAWRNRQYATAWIPAVAREVAGRNLLFALIASPARDIRPIVTAVRRFDDLSRGLMMPPWESQFRYSVFEYAGDPRAVQQLVDDVAARKLLDAVTTIQSASDIAVTRTSDSSFVLALNTGAVVSKHAFDFSFTDHATQALPIFARMVQLPENATPQEIRQSVWEIVPHLVVGYARDFNVPEDVLTRLAEKWDASDQHPDAFFTYSVFLECWFKIQFAKGMLTRRIRESDGQDLRIASYLSHSRTLVTSDNRLRVMLENITRDPASRMMTFAQLMDSMDIRQGGPR